MSINQGCFWIQGTSSLSHENSVCGSFSHPSCHFSITCKALKFSAWGASIQRTSQTPQEWLITEEKWRQTGRWRALTGVFLKVRRHPVFRGGCSGSIQCKPCFPSVYYGLFSIPTSPCVLSSSLVLSHPLEISPQTVFLTIPLPVNPHQNLVGTVTII